MNNDAERHKGRDSYRLSDFQRMNERHNNDEEVDPVIEKLTKVGCLELHYQVQDCYFETKDWRQCTKQVKEFQACLKASKEKK